MNKNLKKVLAAIIVFFLLISSTPRPVFATPGDLDPTFGIGGIVITNPNNYYGGGILATALQPDGKTVAAGTLGFDFALLRYNTNGDLDSTFGNNGRVILNLNTGYGEYFNDVTIQSDGKIVAVGVSYYNNSDREFVITRYNSDGTLDSGFGGNGYAVVDFLGYHDEANSVVLQPDGKIIVTGYSFVNTWLDRTFSLLRLNPDGALDTSYGGSGKILTTSLPGHPQSYDSILQSDGKLVIAGDAGSGSYSGHESDFALVRYNPDGSLDSSFDGDGIVTTDLNNNSSDSIHSVALQSDGKIIVAGLTQVNNAYKTAIARYYPDGNIDTNFGDSGKKIIEFGRVIRGTPTLKAQQNGKFVIATTVSPSDGSDYSEFALARLDLNGSLDSTFGNVGLVITAIANIPTKGEIHDLEIQPDGRLVIGGSSSGGYTLVRFEGDNTNDPPIANAGIDQIANEGQLVIFDGSGSTDPDGVSDIVSYAWDFGDRGTSTGISPTHIYADNGVYTATLTVTDTQGESDTDTAVVTVNNVSPTATISPSPQTIIRGQSSTVNFNNQFDPSTIDTLAGFTYSYDCTNDGIFDLTDSTSTSFSCSYPNSGLYTVVGRINDKDGGYSEYAAFVTVQTPSEAINDLINLVETYNLQQGISNSLDAKLDAALGALDDINQNNNQAATNSLQAFISAVEAQRGIKITNGQADTLIAAAQTIIGSL